MATPAHHPEFYRGRYPVREDLDALIWAWENIPEIRQHFHRPAYGGWGGWGVFSRAAAGQSSVDSDRIELAQDLLRSNGVRLVHGATRIHFVRE